MKGWRRLGDGDTFIEVDVLDGVEEGDAFFEGALEGFTAEDEAMAAGAFIDNGGEEGFIEVILAGGAAGVNEADFAGEAVKDLVAGEVDGVI